VRIALVYDAIYPWVAGGAERRFAEIGRRLAQHHDVHLVGWQWWDGPATIERGGMTLHGLGRAPTLYGEDGKRTVREALAFSARLLPFLLRNRFDVLDCSATPYLPLYPAALARHVHGERLVVTWHEYWGSHWDEYLPHRRLVARLARTVESGGRRIGDSVVAVSDFTARAMGMADEPRMAVVGNGVDIEAIATAEPMPDGADVIFVGRLIDEKRVDLLLQAVALLCRREMPVRCAIIGDGPERAALEAAPARLGIADGVVRFLGRVPDSDVARHLRAARILVMPSLREGYGLAVAEAQAAGAVPVVVRGPFSAASELVHDAVDGLVVDATAEALADGIGALLLDPARRERMASAARETGAGRSWDAVAERTEQLYRALVAEGEGTEPVRKLRWS
jgi:glycosyltransferase involved in cell wall biosynthesis